MLYKFTKIGVILALLLLFCCMDTSKTTLSFEMSPNIIIIVTDDAGYSDYSFMGSEINTPHIDKLASNSFIFPNFYNNGRCSPTRASLLTGHYPQKVGVGELSRPSTETNLPGYLGYLNLEYETLAESLKDLGYYTIMSGKWHLGGQKLSRVDEQLKWPLQRGFDSFFGILGGTVRTHFKPTAGDRYMYENDNIPIEVFEKEFYSSDALVDHIVESIKEHNVNREKPFFGYLPFFAPHLPLEAPSKLIDKYVDVYSEYFDMKEIKKDRLDGLKKNNFQEEFVEPNMELFSISYGIPRDEKILALATHAAMMENVDQNIGKLVSYLKSSGQYDNTLIFLMSDNGVSANGISDIFNSPYYGKKGMLWEGGIKTPLVVSWPAIISKQKIIRQAWHVMDVMPTILDILGNKTSSLTGRSFKTILESGVPSNDLYLDRDYLFWSDRKLVAGLSKDGIKWIREEGRGNFLYDLKMDPTELNDLAVERPKVVQEFRRRFNMYKRENNVESFAVVQKSRVLN